MLQHRRTHGADVVAAMEQQEQDLAAMRPPPPAYFNPPIVNQQVEGGSSRPMVVQWMTLNRATRPYTRYPDIPQVPRGGDTTATGSGNTAYAPFVSLHSAPSPWQLPSAGDQGSTPANESGQAGNEKDYQQP
ncbi:hypothetical protein HDZ31DRAFT_38118 [Schizophyllum fasciatum]